MDFLIENKYMSYVFLNITIFVVFMSFDILIKAIILRLQEPNPSNELYLEKRLNIINKVVYQEIGLYLFFGIVLIYLSVCSFQKFGLVVDINKWFEEDKLSAVFHCYFSMFVSALSLFFVVSKLYRKILLKIEYSLF